MILILLKSLKLKMGRYYFGDIEGKFWFGIQDSNDATFFGVDPYPIIHEFSDKDSESESDESDSESEYDEIAYDFEKEHIEVVKKGIEKCKEEIKEYKEKLDTFFNDRSSYNYDELSQALGPDFEKDKLGTILEWYARLLLGEKILACLYDKGQCHFGCEL